MESRPLQLYKFGRLGFHYEGLTSAFMDFLVGKNILQVLPSLGAGGVEQGTLDISEALRNIGANAFVATSGGSRLKELEKIQGTLVQLPLDSKNPLRVLGSNILALKKAIKTYNIDLVHARSRGPAWSAYFACRFLKIPFVTTFHGTYNFKTGAKKFYNSSMVRGDKVIAISDFIHDHILESYKNCVTPERVNRIYRGIDTTVYDPQKISEERKEKLRKQWRLKPEQKVFLMPGRLTRWKGQEIAIKALSLLGDSDSVLVVVGSDQGRHAYRQELMALSLELGLKKRVRIVEHCDDMPAAYSVAHCVVHASTDPEAFGRVIAEGQAMGLPCLVSELGAPQEIILDKETGWSVASGNVEDLCKAMDMTLCLKKHERDTIAVKARERVKSCFSLSQMCQKTLSLYSDLLKEKNKS